MPDNDRVKKFIKNEEREFDGLSESKKELIKAIEEESEKYYLTIEFLYQDFLRAAAENYGLDLKDIHEGIHKYLAGEDVDESAKLKMDRILETKIFLDGIKDRADVLKKLVKAELSDSEAEKIIEKAEDCSKSYGTTFEKEVGLLLFDLYKAKEIDTTEIDPQHTDIAGKSTAADKKREGNNIQRLI